MTLVIPEVYSQLILTTKELILSQVLCEHICGVWSIGI